MNEALDQARHLLRKAQGDAFMMRELAKNPQSPSWGLGFHGQQVVEKSIKAVLTVKGIRYRFTHDLKFLLNLLASHEIPPPPQEEDLLRLLRYAVEERYESLLEPDEDDELDRQRLESLVASVLQWASTLVGSACPPGEF